MGELFLFQKLISNKSFDYVNAVVQDLQGAKYTTYNGYDYITNPTPSTTNLPFNQWLLNNSATGNVVLNNVIMETSTYNGPASTVNQANMSFVGNQLYRTNIFSIKTNNGFVYVGGETALGFNRGVSKFYEGNLALSGSNLVTSSTGNFGGNISSIAINNGFIYAGGNLSTIVRKYNESTLALVGNATYDAVYSIATNNGFLYVGGEADVVRKYHESNLIAVGNASVGATVTSIAINNGFVYASGDKSVQKFNESTLALVGTSPIYEGDVLSTAINNGFLYVGGIQSRVVSKYHEGNLVFVGNTVAASTDIFSIAINNGFVYAPRTSTTVSKYHESNLTFVANLTSPSVQTIAINNMFVYTGGLGLVNTVNAVQHHEFEKISDNSTLYLINKIKEE
jgi:stage V sporulation protein SpoVS